MCQRPGGSIKDCRTIDLFVVQIKGKQPPKRFRMVPIIAMKGITAPFMTKSIVRSAEKPLATPSNSLISVKFRRGFKLSIVANVYVVSQIIFSLY